MNVIKICLKNSKIYWNKGMDTMINNLVDEGYIVHIQRLDNSPYKQWLEGLNTMPWDCIADVYKEGPLQETMEIAKFIFAQINMWKGILEDVDIYVAEQMVYKEPVDGAEIITSCYFWNYENDENLRKEKMAEHFLMEQRQRYYDYVTFQCVKECITKHSQQYDFFFESHVSDPDGINEIYSKPALGDMRTHSQGFLNVDSRLLTYGRVKIVESGK